MQIDWEWERERERKISTAVSMSHTSHLTNINTLSCFKQWACKIFLFIVVVVQKECSKSNLRFKKRIFKAFLQLINAQISAWSERKLFCQQQQKQQQQSENKTNQVTFIHHVSSELSTYTHIFILVCNTVREGYIASEWKSVINDPQRNWNALANLARLLFVVFTLFCVGELAL